MEVPEEELKDIDRAEDLGAVQTLPAAFFQSISGAAGSKQTECMEMWWEYETVG